MPSTKQARRKARGSFLDLPRELRDIIYELSLVSTEVINVLQLATPSRNMKNLRISTALLGISQQVNGEALQIMYGLNTFEAKIALDPRVPHAYDHDLQPRDQGEAARSKTRLTIESSVRSPGSSSPPCRCGQNMTCCFPLRCFELPSLPAV